MNFQQDKDRAADKYIDELFRQNPNYGYYPLTYRANFKAGADWALKSEIVRELIQSLEVILQVTDVKYPHVADVARDALEVYNQAVKGSEE